MEAASGGVIRDHTGAWVAGFSRSLSYPESHQRLSDLLSQFLAETLVQENVFDDTPTSALAAANSALRLRFYNLDSHSVISLKSKPKLSQGVSRVEEHEKPIDPSLARSFLTDPNGLLELRNDSRIMERLDESVYDFGVSYEIECESREAERDKKLIEEFLKENGIDFKYSDINKFAVFLSGKLPT
ncbi:hypothetical protein F3Y22_tig00010533pilonHSYRG00126 [Hibiscus syriacus]|uniref:CYTH domain-containing protein n=1 Tax=Hibiscus syriacus TaxID=106335 RepID=A0A6A3C726_HIBSY|nr:hypothetical protein F3Y22_tig00010533pilonHSYRG00126 [Hibiscus syriacus]